MALKAIISPAKKLQVPENKGFVYKSPQLWNETERLIKVLKKKSAKSIASLMKLSPDLAQLNYERYQNFQVNQQAKDAYPAALLFNGEVYSGLQTNSWDDKKAQYADQHLFILSGLYGILNALDFIQEYRLEMGTKLAVASKKNLYEFWGDKITKTLQDQLNEDDVLINLASTEYFKSVKTKSLSQRIITPVFKEEKNGSYKVVMVYAKKARGYMADFILEHQLKDVEHLKGFDTDGYLYNESLSTENEWVFTR